MMTDEQRISDAVRQLVRVARQVQSLLGTPATKHDVATTAVVENLHGWGYGLPESIQGPDPAERYFLTDEKIRQAVNQACKQLEIKG
jgi:hypothetical protein